MEKQQKALEDELEKIKSENTELYGKVREACVWFLQERTKELKVNPDFTSKPAP